MAEDVDMIDLPFLNDVCRTSKSKIVLLVVDGLGGAADPRTGKSELESAKLPNLDILAGESSCGLTTPVLTGITPGSGPGHMALFGYDPVKYLMGRGILEALGIDIQLGPGDLAARGNFCTVDSDGLLTDRRAGRISTLESAPLVAELDKIEADNVEISVHAVQDYRFVLLMKGKGLDGNVSETDPQLTGVEPLNPEATTVSAQKSAKAIREFINKSKELLKHRETANMILLRGISQLPNLPEFGERYKLNPAAIAAYPMYRGLAKLVGMRVIPTGTTFDDELDTLKTHWDEHDFFFLHYKPADAAGEDGDFNAKVSKLEELDNLIPKLRSLNPDVLVVAGDHSTPAILASHSWHPVPLLVNSTVSRGDGQNAFSEREFSQGSLGRMQATEVMLLSLAHAGKLIKFGP